VRYIYKEEIYSAAMQFTFRLPFVVYSLGN